MKNKVNLRIGFMALLCLAAPAFAWDSTGHRIIASIAYSQLTPQVKQIVDNLTEVDDKGYAPQARFLYASTQPDKWRQQDQGQSATWHYINTPWSVDETPTVPVNTPNLLSVMRQNEDSLISAKTQATQKAKALAYVIHLAGDAHQPLHCINRFSAQFPQGDRGGNLFAIKDNHVANLHAYWDRGASLLLASTQHYPLTNKKVIRLAQELQQRYPLATWGDKASDIKVSDWTAECYAIAQQTAYQLSIDTRPSAQYRTQTATTVAEQLTLAGYRLGNLLNTVLRDKGD